MCVYTYVYTAYVPGIQGLELQSCKGLLEPSRTTLSMAFLMVNQPGFENSMFQILQ
jgi:hypothetical protein